MDNLIWLTVFVIFLATLVGIVVRRASRDKCLRLFDDHHITYVQADGRVLWGDLAVSSQGLELRYDAPFVTRRGLVKSSFLVFAQELESCVLLARSVQALTGQERRARERQVQRTFNPSLTTRALRACRNFVDLLRDAITKSMGLFVGALTSSRGALGKAVQSRSGEVDELGQSLVGAVANAFEPLLERNIGRPVVLSFDNPPGAAQPQSEFAGYLVEYTETFLAVFNEDHESEERFEVRAAESEARDDVQIALAEDVLSVTNTGPDALIVDAVAVGAKEIQLDCILAPGCSMRVEGVHPGDTTVRLERTRRLDWICPRSRSRVRFGSRLESDTARRWSGEGSSPERES